MTDAERDLAWRALWLAILVIVAGALGAVLGGAV